MTAATALRIGTRGSALALIQAGIVRDALAAYGIDAVLEIIVTAGDRRTPDTAWGEGAFVTAIESALLEGRIDVAVHSAKDVPTAEDPRLAIAAFLPRADPRDVVVLARDRSASSLDDLALGARVGTDSPRRTAFLRSMRPDLRVHPLHGNVDTRLGRLDAGQTDALVLAAAGLERLGRAARIGIVLEPEELPPAPGQGALAVQVRATDERARHLAGRLDHPATRRAVEAERLLLAASGGGCRAPLGALGRVHDGRLTLVAGYARPDGDLVATVRGRSRGPEDDDGDLVDTLLADLAAQAAERAQAAGWPRVIVTRPADQAAATMLALVDAGFAPIAVPTIAIQLVADGAFGAVMTRLEEFDWVVVTSPSGARAIRGALAGQGTVPRGNPTRRRPRWAVVGRATERALRRAGIRADVQPADERAAALAEAIPIVPGDRILLPRSDVADGALPAALEHRGAIVTSIAAYRTIEGPSESLGPLRAALARNPVAIVVTSPSAVGGLMALAATLGSEALAAVHELVLIPIGPTTASAVRVHGLKVGPEPTTPAPADLAGAVATALAPSLESR